MDTKDITLSFIVPTLNEEGNVIRIYNIIGSFCEVDVTWELIFVDDNSEDNTVEEILSIDDPRVNLVKSPQRRGLGHALNQGWQEAKMDFVCFLDCDSKVPSQQVVDMLKLADTNSVVIGSRFISGSSIHGVPYSKVLGSKLLNKILAILLKVKASDLSHSLRVFPNIEIKIDEVLSHPGYMWFHSLKFIEMNYRIIEVPVTFEERDIGITKNKLSKLLGSLKEFLKAFGRYKTGG